MNIQFNTDDFVPAKPPQDPTSTPPHAATQQLYPLDVTPQFNHTYFQSPNSDMSPVFAPPTQFFSAPSSATNSMFQFANTPVMASEASGQFAQTPVVLDDARVLAGSNFSPVNQQMPQFRGDSDQHSSVYGRQPVQNWSSVSFEGASDLGLGVYTEDANSSFDTHVFSQENLPPKFKPEISASTPKVRQNKFNQRQAAIESLQSDQFQIPPQQHQFIIDNRQSRASSVGTLPLVDLSPPIDSSNSNSNSASVSSVGPRSNSADYDSPTTIEVSSPRSSMNNGNLGDITADDILNIDPFEVIQGSDPRKLSEDIVSSFVDFEIGEKSSEELDIKQELGSTDFSNMLVLENPGSSRVVSQSTPLNTIGENGGITKTQSARVSSESIAPTLKKQASSSKINKKTLRKVSSFNEQTFSIPLNNTISSISIKSDPKKLAAKPTSLSFSECSQRFTVSSLNSKYSFVYENAAIEQEFYPALTKSQSSVSMRQLQSNHKMNYQYDSRESNLNSDSSPRLLRNMKAGMAEFQVNLGKRED